MTNIFGLRERKKAQLRLDLLASLLTHLLTNNFEDIKVNDLCDDVQISEVTFFKYFEKKEELLLYFMLIWNYKREIKLLKSGRKKGISAIYEIFDDIATTENATKIMTTLIGYISKTHTRPIKTELSPCEKWLIHNEETIETPMELDAQILLHLSEAIQQGQLKADTDTTALHIMLSTLYYGTPLITHMLSGNLQTHYRENLNLLFHNYNNSTHID